MKIKKILPYGILASLTLVAALLLQPVQAAVQPGIEGGDIYRVRNITKGTDFSDPVTADKCEELQYRVRIHNPGPDAALENVIVKAVLPPAAATQNTSTVTVSATNANPTTTSDTATVNLAGSYKIEYVPGSSQLLNAQGGVISSIADVTSGSGVNIGNVGISINERRFVQFRAKVDCPQTPPPVQSKKCEALNVTQVNRTHYKFTAVAQVQNVTIQNYVFRAVKQGGGEVDTKTVTTGATTADYDFNRTEPGTYIIEVVISTSAGPTSPDQCRKQITIEEEGKPPVPPVTPQNPTVTPAGTPPTSGGGSVTVLPETGPADIAGYAILVTAISYASYLVLMRKFIA